MKIADTKYEDYIANHADRNLHPKLVSVYNKFPDSIRDFRNIIFYGPSGVGKYTQMLSSILKYSPTGLNYEKKICINYAKQNYYMKISDVHFEVDMALLGCNSKLLWTEIFTQIVDIVLAYKTRAGIIVCKNFQEVNNELLEIFYSYMQTNNKYPIYIKFVFLTTQISFIPDCIIHTCKIISIPRPTRTQYNKCTSNKLETLTPLEDITNIKNVINDIRQLSNSHYKICDKIINSMLDIETIKFIDIREVLYDIFIYNLDIGDCIWYIVRTLMEKSHIKEEHVEDLFKQTISFFAIF